MAFCTKYGRLGVLFNSTVNLLTNDHIFNILEAAFPDRESLVVEL